MAQKIKQVNVGITIMGVVRQLAECVMGSIPNLREKHLESKPTFYCGESHPAPSQKVRNLIMTWKNDHDLSALRLSSRWLMKLSHVAKKGSCSPLG